MDTATATDAEIAAVKVQLERVLASPQFRQCERLRRFLRFTVEHAIRRQTGQIKEFSLGVEVFDKGSAFDPRLDATVRVQARRLRSRLRDYFENQGRLDPVLIEYPKGTYVPIFTVRRLPPLGNMESAVIPDWGTVAVLPFVDLSPTGDLGYVGDGFAEELVNRLTRVRGLQVVSHSSIYQFKGKILDVREIGRALQVDAALEGSVRRAGRTLRVTVQLVQITTGFILWSEVYERPFKDVLSIEADLSTAIAGKIEDMFQLTVSSSNRSRDEP